MVERESMRGAGSEVTTDLSSTLATSAMISVGRNDALVAIEERIELATMMA